MSKLDPCPCCNTEPVLKSGYEGVITITCPGCGLMSGGHYPTPECTAKAYAKWNRRVIPATIRDDVMALCGLVTFYFPTSSRDIVKRLMEKIP